MLMICIDDKTKENKKITHVEEGKYHQQFQQIGDA
jgi:hypothetical protein